MLAPEVLADHPGLEEQQGRPMWPHLSTGPASPSGETGAIGTLLLVSMARGAPLTPSGMGESPTPLPPITGPGNLPAAVLIGRN
jgi:hypothetical protein